DIEGNQDISDVFVDIKSVIEKLK
ncbi:adenylate kinase, partial [Streptococcus iniae]